MTVEPEQEQKGNNTKNPAQNNKEKQKTERDVMVERIKELEGANGRLESENSKLTQNYNELRGIYQKVIRQVDLMGYNLASLAKKNDLDFMEENKAMEKQLMDAAKKQLKESKNKDKDLNQSNDE